MKFGRWLLAAAIIGFIIGVITGDYGIIKIS